MKIIIQLTLNNPKILIQNNNVRARIEMDLNPFLPPIIQVQLIEAT